MAGLSTAGKLSIARALRRAVGVWLAMTGRDAGHVACTRRGVRWALDLNEGVQLALYLGVYEGSTTRALARVARPGAIAIDIGANIGAQALPLARHLGSGGRVIAVEPADTAFGKLRANLALNPDLESRVTLVHKALGAPGAAPATQFFASWPLEGAPGAHPIHRGAPHVSTSTASTLDELVRELALDRVDVIKLDVDGHELPVLAGAHDTLRTQKPIVVFELAPYLLEERGESPAALPRVFVDHGYRLFDEATFAPLPADLDALVRTIPAGGSRNIIAAAAPI